MWRMQKMDCLPLSLAMAVINRLSYALSGSHVFDEAGVSILAS